MLEPEDCAILGMAAEPPPARRPSALSQVLRAVRDVVDNGSSAWDLAGAEEEDGKTFRIRVASDSATRERAYALAYRVYRDCGYVGEEKRGLCVEAYDADPGTLTLIAEDAQGRDAATVSLVFDSGDGAGLPCDELYRAELEPLRAQGRRLCEVTRLAISEAHARSKVLLLRLFNFIYVYARRVKGWDDFLIEVNPRHVNYYRRLLKFEPSGPQRSCGRVNGAPAVLLRLDLAVSEAEIRRVAGKEIAAQERTLYPHFYTWLEEGAVAQFQARNHRPMTAGEAAYFGLSRSPHTPPTIRTQPGSERLTIPRHRVMFESA